MKKTGKILVMALALVVAMSTIALAAPAITNPAAAYDAETGVVTVTGTIADALESGQESTILVLPESVALADVTDADIYYIDQITAESDGSFSYSFKMPESAPEGTYVVYLGGTSVADVDSTQSFTIGGTTYTIVGSFTLVSATKNGTVTVKAGDVDGVVDAEAGTFTITVPAAGEYEVTIAAPGYVTYTKTVAAGAELENVALIAGDVSGNAWVDADDLSGVLGNFNKTTASSDWETAGAYDFSGNDWVDASDLSVLLSNFNKTSGNY